MTLKCFTRLPEYTSKHKSKASPPKSKSTKDIWRYYKSSGSRSCSPKQQLVPFNVFILTSALNGKVLKNKKYGFSPLSSRLQQQIMKTQDSLEILSNEMKIEGQPRIAFIFGWKTFFLFFFLLFLKVGTEKLSLLSNDSSHLHCLSHFC